VNEAAEMIFALRKKAHEYESQIERLHERIAEIDRAITLCKKAHAGEVELGPKERTKLAKIAA